MAHAEQHGSHHHHEHHIIPKKTLLTIFGALVFLTALTVVTATQLDLGVFDVPLALAIAGVKATLVVMFFMALKYDRPVNTLVFSSSIVFVTIFLAFTLFDTAWRGDLGNVAEETILDEATRIEQLEARMKQEAAEVEGAAIGNEGGDETDVEAESALEEGNAVIETEGPAEEIGDRAEEQDEQ